MPSTSSPPRLTGPASPKMTLVQPNPEMQLRIRSELNEDVSTRDDDLQHVKEWLSRQPHLPKFEGAYGVYHSLTLRPAGQDYLSRTMLDYAGGRGHFASRSSTCPCLQMTAAS